MSFIHARHRRLLELDTKMFTTQRDTLLILWQEIAEQFYPERADFTYQRTAGETFASDLDTSYPVLARRDLANAFGSMLRPPAKQWFHIKKKGAESGLEDERQ